MQISVGAVSLHQSTLRYYEEEGLLTNVQKSASGQRIYTQEHIDRLHCINCFKRTGMTLAQLKKLFEYETDEVAQDPVVAADDVLRRSRG